MGFIGILSCVYVYVGLLHVKEVREWRDVWIALLNKKLNKIADEKGSGGGILVVSTTQASGTSQCASAVPVKLAP